MPRNPEIDRLKAVSDQSFSAKQAAYGRMKSLGQQRYDLKEQMDINWGKVASARSEMNSAYERQQSEWEVYRDERNAVSLQIDSVARDANNAHEAMKDAFERASDAYNNGDKASAPFYSQEGKDYRYERDSFNAEKARLISIAKSMTPPHSNFHRYKDTYVRLMEEHKALQAKYQTVKSQHESARAEFDRTNERYEAARAAFGQAISEEQAKWRDVICLECGGTIRINVEWSHPPRYCKSCKEKFKERRNERSTLYSRLRSNHSPIELPAKAFWHREHIGAYHLTMKYSDGYRVSWNATERGDKDFHWTNENLPKGHNSRHVPPEDCRV